jgi:hypothetical protein
LGELFLPRPSTAQPPELAYLGKAGSVDVPPDPASSFLAHQQTRVGRTLGVVGTVGWLLLSGGASGAVERVDVEVSRLRLVGQAAEFRRGQRLSAG